MAVRRCPECETINRPTVATCECGYVFDALQAQAMGLARRSELDEESLTDQRHYHLHRLTIGYLSLGGAMLLFGAAFALYALGSTVLLLPGAGCVLALAKGVQLIHTSQRHLRIIEGRDAVMPRARLLKK